MASNDVLEFKFEIQGLSQTLRVLRFEGQEGISTLFSFRVTVSCEDSGITFEKAIGHEAVLTLNRDGERRYVHGIVSRFEQAEEAKNVTLYHATLVPRAWRLQHRHDHRIFQDLTIPAIMEKVLKDAGFSSTDYRLFLEKDYRAHEYCVQYGESDWAFIIRLMEEAGIYSYFDHAEERHVLILCDTPFAHKPISGSDTLPFRAPLGAMAQDESVSRFIYVEEVRPGSTTVRDYNFKRPNLLLEGKAQSDADTDLEVYTYPGEHETPRDGAAVAKVRLEQWQVFRKAGEGASSCHRFAPGHLFTLADHPCDAFNQRYVITQVDHRGGQAAMGEAQGQQLSSYENRFHCIPEAIPLRSHTGVPRPTIKGIQTAIVVGPAGEEIYTDEHGRVKVQFHWDREGKHDERSSCWIRVSQAWAGPAWGAMYIPRIGMEVIVDFLEGDPDRPLIVGCVYHGTNVPPYALPGEKTKSTLRSNSSPGGGGYNELRFEDRKSEEEIFLHGQKDWTIEIEHDKNQTVGHDETHEVGHERRKTVKASQWETIGGNKTIDVAHDHRETIADNEILSVGKDLDVTIGNDETENVGRDRKITVGRDHDETITRNATITIGAHKTEKVNTHSDEHVCIDKTTTVEGKYSIGVKKSMSVQVDEDSSESVGGDKTLTVGNQFSLTCGDGKITVKKDGTIVIEGKDISVKGTGTVKVEGNKIEVKSDSSINVKASGSIKLQASSVDVN